MRSGEFALSWEKDYYRAKTDVKKLLPETIDKYWISGLFVPGKS